ncbi:MAG: hypothetical protein AAB588_03140 [Patescibacteria group bacterium]
MLLILSLAWHLAVFEPPSLCTKIEAPFTQQIYVRYASSISGDDKNFLALLQGENDTFDPLRRSQIYDPRTNSYEDSYGFCQIHRPSHRELVEDPLFFSDPFWQMERCLELYKGGTPFGAKKNIPHNKQYFDCP